MPLTSSNAVRQLSDQNPLGTILGASTSDVIGFYGLTQGITRPNLSGIISTGAVVSTIVAALHNLGLVNSSAATP